jgi:hypothetical protein
MEGPYGACLPPGTSRPRFRSRVVDERNKELIPLSESRKRKDARTFVVTVIALGLVFLSLLVPGCGEKEPQAEVKEENAGAGEVEAERETGGEIELTLYFRRVTETEEYLAPERRTVPYTRAVARAAITELIKGPSADSGLYPVLPSTVEVIDVWIDGGTCYLDLSKEVITDSGLVGCGARGEQLALGAIADTLTEFPAIERVKLLVEGSQEGEVDGRRIEDFWGHVGLPEYLDRDESLILPAQS